MEDIVAEKNTFPLDSKVRFTEARLSVLMPQDRKRLEGRIGVVQGYWNYTRKPVVYFPQEGARSELRLLRVDPRHLEMIEQMSIEAETEPRLSDETAGSEKLSQSDMDKLFD